MATIQKRKNGTWRAQIRRQGHKPLSKTFSSKSTAVAWARKTEHEQDRGVWHDTTAASTTTLGTLLDRYEKEVLPSKRSQQAVKSQIRLIKKKLANTPLTGLTPAVLSQYRDYRLKTVSSQTARHELSLIQRLLNVAIKEWAIHLPNGNPVDQIRLPSIPAGRDRRPTQEELATLSSDCTIGSHVVLATETGLRRSEISRISLDRDFDPDACLLTIRLTKNGCGRVIPLSTKAIEVLPSVVRKALKPDSITQAFDRACKRYGIQNLRFHDLRHEATSRFFELGLNPVEVASITGHKDTRMLMRYTHIKPETLLRRIT